jgi:hypothetical protein
MVEKVRRFCTEAGALGVGSVIFAFVLWIIAEVEHERSQNISATWFLLGGCVAFCLGAFMAWSKADDRANDRKPKLGFSADLHGFYVTHLEGETAPFIEIESLAKAPRGSKVHFDPVDFIGGGKKVLLTCRLEIVPGERFVEGMEKILIIIFSSLTKPETEYPITLRFNWNDERLEEKIMLRWISEDKRFETRPQ